MANFKTADSNKRAPKTHDLSCTYVSKIDDPRRWIPTLLIQNCSFPKNGWSSMVDSSTADPRWRISKQLIQDGGFQNKLYNMADIRTPDPRGGIQNSWSKNGGFQNSWPRTADTKWRIPKPADFPEQKSEGQAEQWRPAKEGLSAFSSSYPKII